MLFSFFRSHHRQTLAHQPFPPEWEPILAARLKFAERYYRLDPAVAVVAGARAARERPCATVSERARILMAATLARSAA